MKLWIPGTPKPEPRPKSRVVWKGPEFAAACAQIARGLRGKAAQKALERALFVTHYVPRSAAAWRRDVETALKAAGFDPLAEGVPASVRMSFVVPRPKAHYGTGRNAGIVKERSRELHPVTRGAGDIDNICKATLDAAAPLTMHDDSQVIDLCAGKRYVTEGEAGCMLEIVEVR